jgi:MFS family permease
MAALALLPADAGLIAYAVLFGLGVGATTPLRAALVADIYGTRHYGVISGAMGVPASATRALAPVAAGLLVGLAGYAAVPWVCLGANVCAAAAILFSEP